MPPTFPPRPSSGLFSGPRPIETIADLFANVWQLGYVTTDLDRAIDELGATLGLEHCLRLPSAGATFRAGDVVVPWESKFAMAARGGLIIELIEPVSGEVGFYRDLLPADGLFAIRLHHLAMFTATGDAEWSGSAACWRPPDCGSTTRWRSPAGCVPATSTREPCSATSSRSASFTRRTSNSSARSRPTVRRSFGLSARNRLIVTPALGSGELSSLPQRTGALQRVGALVERSC